MPYRYDPEELYKHVMTPVVAFLANFEIYLEHEFEQEKGLQAVLKFIPRSIWPIIDTVAYTGADEFILAHGLEDRSRLPDFGNVEGHQLREALAFLLKIAWQRGYLMYKFHRLDYLPAPNESVDPNSIMDRIVSSGSDDFPNLSTNIDVFLQRAVSVSTEEDAVTRSLAEMPRSLHSVLEPFLDDWADALRSSYGWGILSAKAESELEQEMEPRVQITAGDGSVVVVARHIERSFNDININVSKLMDSGQSEIAEALRHLTDAAIKSDEFSEENRTAVLERFEEIARQATLPVEKRSRAVVRDLVVGIETAVGTAGGLASVWSVWGEAIKQFFNL